MAYLLYQSVRTFSMMNLLFQNNAYCRSSVFDGHRHRRILQLTTPTHVSIVCLTSQLTLLSAHPRPSRFHPDKMMKIPQNVACNLCTTTPTRLTDQVSLCTATTTVRWLLSTSDELFCSTSSLTSSDAGGYTDDDFHE